MNKQQKLENFLITAEGEKLKAYKDSAGIWTIGVGSTHGVSAGMVITKEESRARLRADTRDARNAVAKHVTVDLTDNQWVALCSLVFNIGAGAFAISTLLKRLNEGHYTEASKQFLVWNKITVNGKKVTCDGLSNRRKKEKELFDTPDEKPKPLAKSRTIAGQAVVATGVSLTAANDIVVQAQTSIQPVTDYSDTLKYIFIALTLAGIAITIYARINDAKKGVK